MINAELFEKVFGIYATELWSMREDEFLKWLTGKTYNDSSILSWTLCSETEDVPEHEVLCADKYGHKIIGYLDYNDDQWLCESDAEMMYDPVIWTSLPDNPYKEQ